MNPVLKVIGLNLVVCLLYVQAKQKVEVPLNIGLGPEMNMYNGLIGREQVFHYGLKLDIHAFIDKGVIRKNQNKIPKSIRRQVLKLNSVRISKIYIPESIIISPKLESTGIYGVNFRPLSVSLPLVSGAFTDVYLSAGANITYLFIQSDSLFADQSGNAMHFLRPGLSAKLNLQLKPSQLFHISLGLEGTGYLPQELSAESKVLEAGKFDERSLWGQGQIYALLNFRLPMKVSL